MNDEVEVQIVWKSIKIFIEFLLFPIISPLIERYEVRIADFKVVIANITITASLMEC